MLVFPILFFILSVFQLALIYYTPTPMPFWAKIASVVAAFGMIDCIALPYVIARARQRKARDSRLSPGTSDK